MIILTAGLFAGVVNALDLPDAGKWIYYKETDEFTDEVSHDVLLTADDTPTSGDKVAIIISCRENTTYMAVITHGEDLKRTYGNDLWEADYRIDDLKGNKFKVSSTDSVFTPYPASKHITLIKSMFNHDKLRLRFRTYNGSETVTFKITGIENEIKPIRQACGW